MLFFSHLRPPLKHWKLPSQVVSWLRTSETVRELSTKLRSSKFDGYVSQHARDVLLIRLIGLIELVDVVDHIRASRDPKDDKFLEAAVNGHADVVVSGDRDLLDLNPFREIQILTPRDYLRRQK